MEYPVNPDRRTFLRRGAMGAGAVWMLSLQELAARAGHAARSSPTASARTGRSVRRRTRRTGLELLKLPDGFRYWSYSWTGDVMSDGVRVRTCTTAWPSSTTGARRTASGDDDDGSSRAGVDRFDRRRRRGRPAPRSGKIVLVRNHEGDAGPPYVDRPARHHLRADRQCDRQRRHHQPGVRHEARQVGGVLVEPRRHGPQLRRRRDAVGHVAHLRGDRGAGHGWVFDVGYRKGNTTPLIEMGRFSHEALMVDPRSGFVYETEDSGNAGFYKFVPYRAGPARSGRPALHAGDSSNQPNARSRHVLADRHAAGTSSGCASTIRGGDRVVLRAGRRQGRRALQPSRRRLVGRPHRLLPLDQRRQRRRRPGVRVRPARRDAEGDLRRAERRRASTTRTT